MTSSTVVALIDLDAFFAQVEQYEHPEYRGKPIIIGGQPGGRGVVSTASYEARRFGIHSAMPTNTAYRLCPEGIFLKGNMPLYQDYSHRIYQALHDISPVVVQASIDEFYLDLSGLKGLFGTPRQIGMLGKEAIKKATGLTCSVGIGPNRLIAKLASEYEKPDGLTVVAPKQVLSFLDPMPLKNLRGVGKKTLPRLKKLHVNTLGELRQRYSLEQLHHLVGNHLGDSLYYQSRGIYPDREKRTPSRQSISKETTFGVDVDDPVQLKQVIHHLAFQVARTLRKQGEKAVTVRIRVRLSDFKTYTRQQKLSSTTVSDLVIARIGWSLFEKNGYMDKKIRLIGIGVEVGEDTPAIAKQLDLFEIQDTTNQQDDIKVTSALDQILDRFGEEAIRRGG